MNIHIKIENNLISLIPNAENIYKCVEIWLNENLCLKMP